MCVCLHVYMCTETIISLTLAKLPPKNGDGQLNSIHVDKIKYLLKKLYALLELWQCWR